MTLSPKEFPLRGRSKQLSNLESARSAGPSLLAIPTKQIASEKKTSGSFIKHFPWKKYERLPQTARPEENLISISLLIEVQYILRPESFSDETNPQIRESGLPVDFTRCERKHRPSKSRRYSWLLMSLSSNPLYSTGKFPFASQISIRIAM
jgi:hypothetical protein